MTDESTMDDYTPPNMNEEESTAWGQMSADARRQLQDYDHRIRSSVQAQRVWENLLTGAERDSLGGNLEEAWRTHGTLGLWMQAKGHTNRFTALAELVHALATPLWLVSRARLASSTAPPPAEHPVWNPRNGVLSMAGQTIRRRVRLYRHPSNVQRILDAFQDAGWPDSVDNPLDDVRDEIKLHQAVHQLNQSLREIRFSVSQGAAVVSWSRVKD